MNFENLHHVLEVQLIDLASAEDQLVEALPEMAAAASCSQLKEAFIAHLHETREQLSRIDQIFHILKIDAQPETCEAMRELIAEVNNVIEREAEPDTKDAALIAAAQRIDHYEMAGYGCARTFARQLGQDDVADLLQDSLDEEVNSDKALTSIADEHINLIASHYSQRVIRQHAFQGLITAAHSEMRSPFDQHRLGNSDTLEPRNDD